MRTTLLLLGIFALVVSRAAADCPPDCVAGGGPVDTDCFVTWSGIASMNPSCVDGTDCDLDGTADGVCTLALQTCINTTVPGSTCVPGTLDALPTVKPASTPTAQALASSIATLGLSGAVCSAPGIPVPLKTSIAGIKRGVAKLTVTAASSGRRDKDKLRLTCEPNLAPPSFAAAVQPIFTAKCNFSECHSSSFRGGGQSLEPADAYAGSVNVPSTGAPKLMRVRPGSLRKSFLARKILGVGIPPFGGATMPLGCPAILPPVTECLTDAEKFTILSWIANGAPNN